MRSLPLPRGCFCEWRTVVLSVMMLAVAFSHGKAFAQGAEASSAIVGQVTDATGAVVADASVTVARRGTALERSAKTDNAGRFNIPQLEPSRKQRRMSPPRRA
jgi:hypothetical protein